MVVNAQVDLRPKETSESLIRRFLTKVKKEGIVREVKAKEYHLTKSQKRRLKKAKAKVTKIIERKKNERAQKKMYEE
jgi:ribosomal protein S21